MIDGLKSNIPADKKIAIILSIMYWSIPIGLSNITYFMVKYPIFFQPLNPSSVQYSLNMRVPLQNPWTAPYGISLPSYSCTLPLISAVKRDIYTILWLVSVSSHSSYMPPINTGCFFLNSPLWASSAAYLIIILDMLSDDSISFATIIRNTFSSAFSSYSV